MLSVTRYTHRAPSDWKTPFAVVGAVTAGVIGAKLLRQALIWAQFTLFPPVVVKYAGEWALVTGGSEGIGKGIAAELAKYDINVILVSRSQAKLDAAAKELRQKYQKVQVRTYAADLTDAAACSNLLQHLSDNNLHISILIANAGGIPGKPTMKPYWEFTESEESHIEKLNGQACYSLVRSLIPAMVAANKGAVVCISSVAHRLTAFMTPYGAEKAKMNALCSALDVELQGTGVTAQAMVLGMVITPAIARIFQPNALEVTDGSSSSSSDASSVDVAAAVALIKPNALRPSAETAAAAIVRCIGRGGPVVTPYWGHALSEMLVHSWWPPELHRALVGSVSRGFKASFDKIRKNAEAAQQQ